MNITEKTRNRLGIFARIFLILNVLPKTFIFLNRDPVILNYAFTAASIFVIGFFLIFRFRHIPNNQYFFVLVLLSIIWTVISGFQSGILLNVVASVTFAITAIGFGFIIPALVYVSGRELTSMLRDILAVTTIASVLLVVAAPSLATDIDSGRTAGVYISVAVASSMFGFATIFSLRAALLSPTLPRILMWSMISFASLALLYFTRTRSSLMEVLSVAVVIVFFTPLPRGIRLVITAFMALTLLGVGLGATAVSTGAVAIDDQLEQFRLVDNSLSDSRGGNWDFGVERIIAHPVFGEGLLTKQTQGGTTKIDFSNATSYDPRYDPHSIVLSFGVEGGIPFMIFMTALFVLIPARFVHAFGWRTSLQTPEFLIPSARLIVSIFSGGDMTTLGNIVEKIVWLMLGTMMIKAELKLRSDLRGLSPAFGPGRGITLPAAAYRT